MILVRVGARGGRGADCYRRGPPLRIRPTCVHRHVLSTAAVDRNSLFSADDLRVLAIREDPQWRQIECVVPSFARSLIMPTIACYSLDGPVLPRVQATLSMGEAARCA